MSTPGRGADDAAWTPYRLLRPLLFRLDPERAHGLALGALTVVSRVGPLRAALAATAPPPDPRLQVRVLGRSFPHPVGLAAGMDKDGTALPAWAALGFGHVEVGTVTAQSQPGNPRPRVFRLPADRAIVNRIGFASEGADRVAARLRAWRQLGAWPPVPIGVNLGKSRAAALDEASEDYLASLRTLASFADYLVVNVSSPNTPQLRALQDGERLEALVRTLTDAAGGVPLLVKLAPDLNDAGLREATQRVEAAGAAGVIVVNTTVRRAGLRRDPGEAGGLSGRPLAPRARSALRVVRAATRLPVVSVGGIDGPEEAVRRLEAGADLLQVYTGMVYGGPGLVRRIVRGLGAALEARGLPDLASLRSADPPAGALRRDATGSPPASGTR